LQTGSQARRKEVEQLKADFFNTVSHELRAPLTSMVGFAGLIRRRLEESIIPKLAGDERSGKTLRQITANLEIMTSEGNRLVALLNDLLDIARLEAGQVDWPMQAIPGAELVQEAMDATRALFEHKQINARSDIASPVAPIWGHRPHLVQVLVNLLGNAAKFTPTGGQVTVSVRPGQHPTAGAGDNPGWVSISVSDTGIGILAEHLPLIFEKFAPHRLLAGQTGGNGLGLYICKQIVSHHGGQIAVQSQEGRGSTFTFTLKAAPTG
jgi:signal transduction histidine kinase